jgi:hypothetical protein
MNHDDIILAWITEPDNISRAGWTRGNYDLWSDDIESVVKFTIKYIASQAKQAPLELEPDASNSIPIVGATDIPKDPV